jgi:YidC/Oxa1 family membrane protein insertase
MERRVLVFFAAVTLSFFIFQNYFSPPAQKKATNQQNVSTPQKEEKKNVSFVPLHPSISKKEDPLYGIPFGGQFLVIGEKSPEQLYHQDQVLHKLGQDRQFAIYGPQKRIIFLPNPESKVDVQLISLTNQDLIKPIHATFHSGKIQTSEEIGSQSLCVFENNGHFFPLGLVDNSKKVIPLEEIDSLKGIFQQSSLEPQKGSEEFYTIETPYQQIVFSSIGGSIAEINLPFEPPSVVKEIETDRIMEKQYPENNHFPQFTSRWQGASQRKLGGFYPLLRRDIIGSNGDIKAHISPAFYSMNIIGDGVETLPYRLSRFSDQMIEFTLSQPQRRITKTYYFPENLEKSPYIFYVKIYVEGDASNLWLSTGVPEVELISGSFNPGLKYNALKKGRSSITNLKLANVLSTNITPDWIVNSNGFFGIILDPQNPLPPGYQAEKISGSDVPTKLSLIDARYNKYPVDKYPGYEMRLPLAANQEMTFRVFAGPFEDDILTQLDKTYSDPQKGYSPDYKEAQSYHGFFSFISAPFAKFMFFIMKISYKITGSWAFSIIFITIILRLMLYPLNSWSIKSQAKTQELQPKLKALQQKFKKDPKKLQMETMKLYREHGVNPFMGCFPLLIQMPFLFGMFDLLKSTFELRGATFIPGWIDSLTSPDVLFSWDYPIFFIGNQFHLLPILLGAVMYIQQRYTLRSSGADMTKLTEQQRQQVATGNIMVVVFTVLFYHFPSGLNLYWLFSSILGIVQQHFIKKKTNAMKASKPPKK